MECRRERFRLQLGLDTVLGELPYPTTFQTITEAGPTLSDDPFVALLPWVGVWGKFG